MRRSKKKRNQIEVIKSKRKMNNKRELSRNGEVGYEKQDQKRTPFPGLSSHERVRRPEQSDIAPLWSLLHECGKKKLLHSVLPWERTPPAQPFYI